MTRTGIPFVRITRTKPEIIMRGFILKIINFEQT